VIIAVPQSIPNVLFIKRSLCTQERRLITKINVIIVIGQQHVMQNTARKHDIIHLLLVLVQHSPLQYAKAPFQDTKRAFHVLALGLQICQPLLPFFDRRMLEGALQTAPSMVPTVNNEVQALVRDLIPVLVLQHKRTVSIPAPVMY